MNEPIALDTPTRSIATFPFVTPAPEPTGFTHCPSWCRRTDAKQENHRDTETQRRGKGDNHWNSKRFLLCVSVPLWWFEYFDPRSSLINGRQYAFAKPPFRLGYSSCVNAVGPRAGVHAMVQDGPSG